MKASDIGGARTELYTTGTGEYDPDEAIRYIIKKMFAPQAGRASLQRSRLGVSLSKILSRCDVSFRLQIWRQDA
jgi:hypothetical protein